MLLWRSFESEIARAQLEVVADDALDVVDAGLARARVRRERRAPGARSRGRSCLPEQRRLRREADERALELAHVRADRLREEEHDVVGELDLLDLRLLAEDGDARLELGPLDVGDETPREARDEALLHLLELLRVLVARDDDLLVGLVERVERVEELFLRLRLRGEELDVVDEEEIAALAVARAELVHAALLEGLDELVHELLGRHVEDARRRALGAEAVRDGVHEVRLAEAGAAADEERVVPRAAAAGRGDRGRVRELVRRTDDEVPEGVLRVQPFDGRRHRGRLAVRARRIRVAVRAVAAVPAVRARRARRLDLVERGGRSRPRRRSGAG